MDVKDILASHRTTEMEEAEAARGGVDFSEEIGSTTSPPPELTRRYVKVLPVLPVLDYYSSKTDIVNPNTQISCNDTSIVFSALWYHQIRLIFFHFDKYVPRTLVNWLGSKLW